MSYISGWHHVTMSTDSVREDFDLFTKDLGLYSVKRNVLFDRMLPVYDLYCGSRNGDASTIFTTFPFRKPGVFGRRGTHQTKTIQASIPVGEANFWVDRFNRRGAKTRKFDRFGTTRVGLEHPCGIPLELIETPADPREPISNEQQGVARAHGVKGIYGGAISVSDRSSMDDFLPSQFR